MKQCMRDDGFTLMELLITIVTGALVTLAATTMLLLGLRFNTVSVDAAKSQNTTRILLTVLENLAAEGVIMDVVDTNSGGWEVKGENNTVLLTYVSTEQAIYTGATQMTPVMEGVIASHVSRDNTGKLLTFFVETVEGSFSASIYCRTVEHSFSADFDLLGNITVDDIAAGETAQARKAFLTKLISQYKMADGQMNPGVILDDSGLSTGKYYSEWYIGSYDNSLGWNENTPWCACFVSWAVNEVKEELNSPVVRAANVDVLFEEFSLYSWRSSKAYLGNYKPVPGDLVFFDWIVNDVQDPQHVGVVISESDDYIYTIEGNSAGIVAVRKYPIDDKRILGYGILNWKTQ